jgi:hypothetical protein
MVQRILGASSNVQVTFDGNPQLDRSESAIAANPLNPLNIVGSSKNFTNPLQYTFTLAAYVTFDGGSTWDKPPPLRLCDGWVGISNPTVSWDGAGNSYIVSLPFAGAGSNFTPVGIAVYQSTDGGRTWGLPNIIHTGSGDDKQAAAGDWNPTSPHFGNVYVVWDDGSGAEVANLAFARTVDSGATWVGLGTQAAGTHLAGIQDSFSPKPTVSRDGTLYVFWTSRDGQNIKFVKSTDGGDSFTGPSVVATGITSLDADGLFSSDSFPGLPGGKFRVDTTASACAGVGGVLTVVWADYGEGVSRIYYRTSSDRGLTWQGDPTGQPLLTGAVASLPTHHDFNPQLACTPAGQIACVFYEFGPLVGYGPSLINVIMAASSDCGQSFSHRVTVTDEPWDPAVDAPLLHGKSTSTFIGDYFGFTASPLGFFPFWTDTRTGMQEVFTARAALF